MMYEIKVNSTFEVSKDKKRLLEEEYNIIKKEYVENLTKIKQYEMENNENEKHKRR